MTFWKMQALNDQDRCLAPFGILTSHLATSDLRAENQTFLDFFSHLPKRLKDSEAVRHYRAFFAAGKHSAPSLRFELTEILRVMRTPLRKLPDIL